MNQHSNQPSRRSSFDHQENLPEHQYENLRHIVSEINEQEAQRDLPDMETLQIPNFGLFSKKSQVQEQDVSYLYNTIQDVQRERQRSLSRYNEEKSKIINDQYKLEGFYQE